MDIGGVPTVDCSFVSFGSVLGVVLGRGDLDCSGQAPYACF